jgi:hypothetical protein
MNQALLIGLRQMETHKEHGTWQIPFWSPVRQVASAP